MLIHTYDASVEYKSPVEITVNDNLAQSLNSAERKKHKLEILVENMGRTNFVWDMKKMRKGNILQTSNCTKQSPLPGFFGTRGHGHLLLGNMGTKGK